LDENLSEINKVWIIRKGMKERTKQDGLDKHQTETLKGMKICQEAALLFVKIESQSLHFKLENFSFHNQYKKK
jgi:hypothetical protein